MTITVEVTETERAEIARLADLMAVPFAVMAGAALRQGLYKVEK